MCSIVDVAAGVCLKCIILMQPTPTPLTHVVDEKKRGIRNECAMLIALDLWMTNGMHARNGSGKSHSGGLFNAHVENNVGDGVTAPPVHRFTLVG